ncbi:hypothetical protein GCM10020255_014120 [Rhodococcus baikonurensis]
MQLKDNTFLVTGGASGLGEATSAALIAAGARVVIADLGASDGKATAERLGDNATFAPIDITDEDSFTPALDAAESFGPLRGVVHCAGRGAIASASWTRRAIRTIWSASATSSRSTSWAPTMCSEKPPRGWHATNPSTANAAASFSRPP